MDLTGQRLSTNIEDRRFEGLQCAGIHPASRESAGLAQSCQDMMRDAQTSIEGKQTVNRWTAENNLNPLQRGLVIGQNVAEAIGETATGARSILSITMEDIFGEDAHLLMPRSLQQQARQMEELHRRVTPNGPILPETRKGQPSVPHSSSPDA